MLRFDAHFPKRVEHLDRRCLIFEKNDSVISSLSFVGAKLVSDRIESMRSTRDGLANCLHDKFTLREHLMLGNSRLNSTELETSLS